MRLLQRFAVPVLSVWLLIWIVLSWDAIQDDALIHLRYADYLHRVHFITYDGVQHSYGTSSLLFVALLAALRTLTTSPLLSRYVSTFFHLFLFVTFSIVYLRSVRRKASPRIQLLCLSILLLLSLPSAVRWLDDGMETGLVLCFVVGAAWLTHHLSVRLRISRTNYVQAVILGFFLVALRNELAIVALCATVILVLAAASTHSAGWPSRLVRAIPSRSPMLLGALLAAICIRLTMHSFLPDTALAKSHGFSNSIGSLFASAEVILGALLFGMGTFALWIISAMVLLFALRARDLPLLPTLVANALLPTVVLLSSFRGQEVQGVRYLIWALLFSIVWNLCELARLDVSSSQPQALVFAAFITICLVALPTESRLMYRVLTTRARTMRLFMSQPLSEALAGRLGTAMDVGYISYFTRDAICDAAGLVNGRLAASLSGQQRIARCAAERPDFALVNADQAGTLSKYLSFTGWRVCGEYDFANMHQPDRHYLVVKPELAQAVCAATGYHSADIAKAFAETRY